MEALTPPMSLQIDNILRAVQDVRKALLAVEPTITSIPARDAFEVVGRKTDELEFCTRHLEFELNEQT